MSNCPSSVLRFFFVLAQGGQSEYASIASLNAMLIFLLILSAVGSHSG
jgi:hypothetical protein